ncbi:rio1 family protein [Ophiostoma piceae UAMH 11346]|uniref:Serine/threonine-protein kinase RIO2 n=1 Tax=Ophiostoma piceae (strain UAMH 11346) TaxID=1262450 RepID=S3C788_OPHP1|nr:rio1 family protein [Ophiostoma piceae UAMH 11346]
MKLDTKSLRYLTPEDWRVLIAVEMGSRNHEIVPTTLIDRTARLKGGSSGVHRSISTLAKTGLIARVKEAKYDGYRLTYGGLDYLAMHTYSQKDVVYSVGHRVGVGKESDIVMVAAKTGEQRILKIHRLGRISFRTVKTNRDYLRKRQGGSWMYLSRLSAMREYAFLEALREEGFPVPEPFAQSRHTIVMSFIDNALPLRQVSEVPDVAGLYADIIGLILRLARHGLIHGDFNEFNIMIQEQKVEKHSSKAASKQAGSEESAAGRSQIKEDADEEEALATVPILIDFPQMVSMEHRNAEMYFDRDVACVKRFFERRFHFTSTQPGPFYKDALAIVGKNGAKRIDIAVEASGFTKKMSKDLEAAIAEQRDNELADVDDEDDDEDEEDDEDEDEDDDNETGEQEDKVTIIGEQQTTLADDVAEKMPQLSLNSKT